MFPSPTSGQALADEILRKHSELSPPAQQAVGLSGIPAATETRLDPIQSPTLRPESMRPTPGGILAANTPAPTATMTTLANPSKVRGLGPLPGSPEGNNADNLQRLQTSPSGIGGIKNPWGRHALQIADAVGSAFFPAISAGIPGTQLHHNQLLGQAQGAVANDRAGRAAQDEQAFRQAQTAHTQAQTQEIEHPTPSPEEYGTPIAGEKGYVQPSKSGGAAKPVMANGEPVKPPVKPPTTDFGLWMSQNPHGTAEEWLKLQNYNKAPKEGETPLGEDQVKNINSGMQQRYEVLHPKQTMPAHFLLPPNATQKQFENADKLLQNSEQALGTKQQQEVLNEMRRQTAAIANSNRGAVTVMVPGADGTYTSQRLKPGETSGPGAVTTAGMNAQNTPTSHTRTMIETAPKVLRLADRVGQLIEQQENELGPGSSRMKEFFAGKIGAKNAEYTKLRTDTGLLQTALMNMHVGSRGSEAMMQHFKDLIDSSKQDPENLKAALGEIREYADGMVAEGKHGQTAPQTGVPKPGETFNGHKVLKVEKVQ